MQTAQIHFEIPASLLHALNLSQDEFTVQTRLWTAIHLFKTAKLTLTQAAELAGMDRDQFLVELDKQDVPIINYPPAELEAELHALHLAGETP